MARESGAGVLSTTTETSHTSRKPAAKSLRKAKNNPHSTRRTKPAGGRVLLEPLPPMLPATQAEPKPEATARLTPPTHRPSEEAIRARAYQLYLERGCQPGRDIEDWIQAERELQQHRAA